MWRVGDEALAADPGNSQPPLAKQCRSSNHHASHHAGVGGHGQSLLSAPAQLSEAGLTIWQLKGQELMQLLAGQTEGSSGGGATGGVGAAPRLRKATTTASTSVLVPRTLCAALATV